MIAFPRDGRGDEEYWRDELPDDYPPQRSQRVPPLPPQHSLLGGRGGPPLFTPDRPPPIPAQVTQEVGATVLFIAGVMVGFFGAMVVMQQQQRTFHGFGKEPRDS